MKKIDNNTLALGEHTGHSHRATGDDVSVWDTGTAGTLLLKAPKGSTVVHEEHAPVEVPPGNYTRKIVQQWDHFAEELRDVRD